MEDSNALDFSHRVWWVAKCRSCRWIDMSDKLAGGEAIADTGDYADVRCPACDSLKIAQAEPDDAKPEMMRLAQYEAYRKSLNVAHVRSQGVAQSLRSLERFALQDHKGDHLRILRLAVEHGQPVLAAAMKDHGLKRPSGYAREGRLFTRDTRPSDLKASC